MIIDGHRHIIDSYQPILAEMDAFGIDKTVLVGVGVRDLGPVTIADSWVFRWHFLFRTLGMLKARQLVSSPAFQSNLLTNPRNDAVLAAIKRRPDRFWGFAFINPESAQAPDELQRCLDQGMQGLKLALVQYPTDLCGAKMAALCEVAAGQAIPVFMHLGLTKASSHADGLIKHFPQVKFIIAHAGVQCFDETLALARQRDNVFVDTSSYIATAAKIRRLCAKLGAGKLIFGSDIPVMCGSLREALDKIDALAVPASEKAKILGGNLLSILQTTSTLTR
ncbi:amidohydrolase family protein [Methylomonas rosea]|uniref:Amidohydrolase family protein n=1 Tax=Methylomonas rosea TaxID=2952227 RepID=A0ABT1TT89_9GAMM|nr:amidohydrolase family protein [Methylomonas sp. WSC-7]MCQ8117994.1 amidohydrolase family protein [Methylomonas sp. WSC-7]